METIYFLGVDISKDYFDAALTVNGKDFHQTQIVNKVKSIEAFVKHLKKQFSLTNLIVCMEHTGIYCLPLMEVLLKNQVKFCLEPALQIQRAQGMTRGKNDKIDAKRIASYALKNKEQLKFWVPQRENLQRLKALLTTRDRLIKVKVQLQVPLDECADFISSDIQKDMVRQCSSAIRSITKSISKVETAIDDLIRKDASIKEKYRLATSVPGVGPITALHMIVLTNEFTRIRQAKQFACYSGVAPFEHSSGSSTRGKCRVSKLANMNMKKLLHLAAMSAIKYNSDMEAFYQRKVAEGKNKMSVINAVRNKLISRVFACVMHGRLYEKRYQNSFA